MLRYRSCSTDGTLTEMPRKAEGPRPLTHAERQARHRTRKAGEVVKFLEALEQIAQSKTAKDARDIAVKAIAEFRSK
jgi:hypothetical protein